MALITSVFSTGTLASRPTASSSNNGYYYVATDQAGGTLYQSNGSSWLQLAYPVSPTTVAASGLTGATAASRYVGGTVSGAPATGSFLVGDFIVDQSGHIYVCTVAGSPGTWLTGSGGGSGTVTSVALTVPADLLISGSPITTSGTLAVTRATQVANTFLSGPSSGSASTPSFRGIVAADLPSFVGDSGTGGSKGAVPAPAAGDAAARKFLKADGTWTDPFAAVEANGATSVADGGTISHGLSGTPTVVILTPSTSGTMVGVTAKTSTTFTVALKTVSSGAIVAGATQTVYWYAHI